MSAEPELSRLRQRLRLLQAELDMLREDMERLEAMAALLPPEPDPPASIPARLPTALEQDTRTFVDTACAARYLNRQPQTLRGWASKENGPLRPVRIHGRLAWPVAEIRRLVGASQPTT